MRDLNLDEFYEPDRPLEDNYYQVDQSVCVSALKPEDEGVSRVRTKRLDLHGLSMTTPSGNNAYSLMT